MIRITIAAAAVLLSALPAAAGSFFPNLYASRFCELRRVGIELQEARAIAMKEAWSNYRTATYVNYEGKQTSLDVLDAARYVLSDCPELAK